MITSIVPNWTTRVGNADKIEVSYFCPFCDEEQTIESLWVFRNSNIDSWVIDSWVAKDLRNHVVRDCEMPHQIVKVWVAQYSEEVDTNVILFPVSRSGRYLLEDCDGELYHLLPEKLLAIAAGLEDDANELMNRANQLRSLL